MVQTRLSRWHTHIKDRPHGTRHKGRIIQIHNRRHHMYLMCDDGVVVCVDVPYLFREELDGVCIGDGVAFVDCEDGRRLFHSVIEK